MKHFATVLVGVLAVITIQDQAVQVKINGVPLESKGVIRNGATYVPLKAIGTALGGQATFKDGVAEITLPNALVSPGDFTKEPFAWSNREGEAWLRESMNWIEKMEPLISLVDIERIKHTSTRKEEQVRAILTQNKEFFDYLKTAVANRLVLRDWNGLRNMMAIDDSLEASLEFSGTLREEYLSADPPTGLPSPELILKLSEVENEGAKLRISLTRHLQAILNWYDRYPAPPAS